MHYQHETQGRTPRAMLVLGAMVLIIIGLEAIGTAWWIVAMVGLVTLPLIMDVLLNLKTQFELDEETMRWTNRSQQVEVPLKEIDKVKFDGRLDMSVRVTLILKDTSKLRIPYDALPPHRELERELETREVAVQRNAFSLI